MIIELQRFVEFKSGWWGDGPGNHTREAMEWEPMTINTEYVAWARRYPIYGIELCSVYMADRGGDYQLDIPYEEMREILKGEKR